MSLHSGGLTLFYTNTIHIISFSMIRQDIQKITALKGLGNEHLKVLLPLFSPCYFQPMKVVFAQNSPAEFLYFLSEGQVALSFIPYDAASTRMAKINAGDVFGWSAVLGRGSYSMTATTLEECVSFRIKSKDLYNLCQNCPETGIMVIENLAGAITDPYQSTRSFIYSILKRSMGIEEFYTTG